jgi:hypothetical protein
MTTSTQTSTHRLAVEIRAGSWRGRTASGGFDIPIQRNAQGNITDESRATVVQALNDLTGNNPIQFTHTTCAVTSGGMLLRTIDLPAAADDEALKNLVELQIEKEWPLPPEELAWGFQRIVEPTGSALNPETTKVKVTVAAIKSSVFRQYKEILSDCRLQADWIVGASVGSMAEDIASSKTAWLMDVQAKNTDLVHYEWGVPTTAQTFSTGSNELVRNTESSELSKDFLSIIKTIQCEGSPLMLVVAASEACLKKLQPPLQANFPGVPIQSQLIDTRPGASLATQHLITHTCPHPGRNVITLESHEVKAPPAPIDKAPFIRWGVLLAALIMTIFLARRIEPSLKAGKLESQLTQFREQKKLLPEIDRELSFLEHIQNKSLPYMDIIGLLAAHSTPGFQLESMDMGSDRRVQLRGLLQDAHPEDLRAKLLATDWFDQVILDEQTPDRDGRKLTVRITLLVKEHLKRPKATETMLGIETESKKDEPKKGGK